MAVIEGVDKLIRKLDKLGGNSMQELRIAVLRTTAAAHGSAKAYAPVDTGALKQSISMRSEGDDTKFTGIVFTNSPYSLYQEMGTVNMAAQPYMMPALNEHRTTFEAEAKLRLERAIAKAVSG